MSSKKVSMQDIAEQLGVTKVTVHKALKNKDGVSESLKQQIIQKSKDMGYKIPQKSGVKYSFAFIVPKRFNFVSERFYSNIFFNLNQICKKFDYDLTLYSISYEDEMSLNTPHISPDTINGIFFAGEIYSEFVKKLSTLNLPIVTVDFMIPFLDIDAVIADNFHLGYFNTLYLIQNGHINIGFIGNPDKISNDSERYLGYQKALIDNSIEFSPSNCVSNNNPITGLYTSNFTLPTPLPTAFVCHCDTSAYYLIDKLTYMDYKVPDDISIVSFDNDPVAEIINLTSIDISQADFAKKAFELILNRINKNSNYSNIFYTKTNFIIRGSVLKRQKNKLH